MSEENKNEEIVETESDVSVKEQVSENESSVEVVEEEISEVEDGEVVIDETKLTEESELSVQNIFVKTSTFSSKDSSVDVQFFGGSIEYNDGNTKGFISTVNTVIVEDCLLLNDFSDITKIKLVKMKNDEEGSVSIVVIGVDDNKKQLTKIIKIKIDSKEIETSFGIIIDPKIIRVIDIFEYHESNELIILGVGSVENDKELREYSIIDRVELKDNVFSSNIESKIITDKDSGTPIAGLVVCGIANGDDIFVGGGIYNENRVIGIIVKIDKDFNFTNNLMLGAVDIPSIVISHLLIKNDCLHAVSVLQRGEKVGTNTKIFDFDLNEIIPESIEEVVPTEDNGEVH